MFLVFNSIAFPLAFGLSQNENISNKVKMYVSIMAFVLHLTLINDTLRADKWIKHLDSKLNELELTDRDRDLGARVLFLATRTSIKREIVFLLAANCLILLEF